MIGRSRWVGYALLSPALLAVGFLILYPLYLVVATSFRQGKTLNVLRLSELPFGLANYRTILASDATWHSVGVTVVYLLGTLARLSDRPRRCAAPQPCISRAKVAAQSHPAAVGRSRCDREHRVSVAPRRLVRCRQCACCGKLAGLPPISPGSPTMTRARCFMCPPCGKRIPFYTDAARCFAGSPGQPVRSGPVDGATSLAAVSLHHLAGIRPSAALAAILNTLWALREFDIIYLTTGGGPDRADRDACRAHLPGSILVLSHGHGVGAGCADHDDGGAAG